MVETWMKQGKHSSWWVVSREKVSLLNSLHHQTISQPKMVRGRAVLAGATVLAKRLAC